MRNPLLYADPNRSPCCVHIVAKLGWFCYGNLRKKPKLSSMPIGSDQKTIFEVVVVGVLKLLAKATNAESDRLDVVKDGGSGFRGPSRFRGPSH